MDGMGEGKEGGGRKDGVNSTNAVHSHCVAKPVFKYSVPESQIEKERETDKVCKKEGILRMRMGNENKRD